VPRGGRVAARYRGRAVAARYRVSASFVVKLMGRWRAAGTLKPRRVGGAKLHALAPHLELVRRLLAEAPDLTLEELRLRLAAAGVRVGRSSVDRFLTAHKLTRKKDRPRRRAGTSRRRHGARRLAARPARPEPDQVGLNR
jgi:transposase